MDVAALLEGHRQEQQLFAEWERQRDSPEQEPIARYRLNVALYQQGERLSAARAELAQE